MALASCWARTRVPTVGTTPLDEYSTEVTQHPLPTASERGRGHTELAGTTDKRPGAPLVRDEEAAGSNPATPTRIPRSAGCLPNLRQPLGHCWEPFGSRSW